MHSVEPTGEVPQQAAGSLLQALDLVGVLADVARSWEAETDVDRLSQAIVRSAAIAIPGVHRASISLLDTAALTTVAQTDDLIAASDRLQYDLGEGPTMDAALHRDTFRTDDLEVDARWPAFAPMASRMGLRSMLSLHLYVVGHSLGSLNLASERAMAFDAAAEQLGQLFATHAAIALSGARRDRHQRHAITSRDRIGQAKGILMERHQLTEDEAFAMLVAASQDTNIKLRDVANYLVLDVGRPIPNRP